MSLEIVEAFCECKEFDVNAPTSFNKNVAFSILQENESDFSQDILTALIKKGGLNVNAKNDNDLNLAEAWFHMNMRGANEGLTIIFDAGFDLSNVDLCEVHKYFIDFLDEYYEAKG